MPAAAARVGRRAPLARGRAPPRCRCAPQHAAADARCRRRCRCRRSHHHRVVRVGRAAPNRNSAQAATFASFSTTTGRSTGGHLVAQRLVAPGQVGGEQHPRAGPRRSSRRRRCRPRRPVRAASSTITSTIVSRVFARSSAGVSRRAWASTSPADHHPAEHLGPADVDSDGQRVGRVLMPYPRHAGGAPSGPPSWLPSLPPCRRPSRPSRPLSACRPDRPRPGRRRRRS